jgi:hypothetical protein
VKAKRLDQAGFLQPRDREPNRPRGQQRFLRQFALRERVVVFQYLDDELGARRELPDGGIVTVERWSVRAHTTSIGIHFDNIFEFKYSL